MALVFGLIPLKVPQFRSNPRILSLSNCFAGGLFIAIGLIHILPEATEALNGDDDHEKVEHGGHDHGSFPWSYLLCLMSFSFVLLIDKIIFNNSDLIEEENSTNKSFLNKSMHSSFKDNV